MISENLKMIGTISGRITRASGEVIEFNRKNLIVTTGKNYAVNRLFSNELPVISHMGIGLNATPPYLGQQGLEAESITARAAVTAFVFDTTVKFSADFTNIDNIVSEIGLFNAAEGGTMLSRALIGPFPLTPTDTLSLDWNIAVP